MDGSDFYADLIRRGFTLWTDCETLRVSPASALTPEDREAIRAHRAELIACAAFVVVWEGLTRAGDKWKDRRMPATCKEFKAGLAAYEKLAAALGSDATDRAEQLALVPA